MRDVYLRMVEVLQESYREESLSLLGGFLAGQFVTLDSLHDAIWRFCAAEEEISRHLLMNNCDAVSVKRALKKLNSAN